MQFRWSDISYVDEPGTYVLSDRTRVKIDAKHIVLWTHDPDGVFEAYLYPGDKRRAAEYTLTDFHPSDLATWGFQLERQPRSSPQGRRARKVATTCAPSPTAAPTCLTEPERTSRGEHT